MEISLAEWLMPLALFGFALLMLCIGLIINLSGVMRSMRKHSRIGVVACCACIVCGIFILWFFLRGQSVMEFVVLSAVLLLVSVIGLIRSNLNAK